MPSAPQSIAALEFKSTSLTVPALLLASNDLSVIEAGLREKMAPNAAFFRDSPLLIDLHRVNGLELDIDVRQLVGVLRRLKLLPISLRGGTEAQNKIALSMGLALNVPSASSNKRTSASSASAAEPVAPAAPAVVEAPAEIPAPIAKDGPAKTENMLITQPVRSGQRVYSRGDLTVTATVSAGAEIMAEGNIHVYGSLRGRALAGVQGDVTARIFCMDLQAELLSIAGIYQLRDDISKEVQHKAAQVSLDDEMIVIKQL